MKTIGILGGGQLGRMFIQESLNLGVEVHILDPDSNAPCRHLADQFTQGQLTDYETVTNFAQQVDILTIEIENVNTQALLDLEKSGKAVYPQPGIIQMIQDKRKQKVFYQENHLPSADFRLIENKKDVEKNADFLPAFQKLASGGYDGKGVQALDSLEDIDKAFDAPGLLEKKVSVDKEISVIVARNIHGKISTFPPVEMVFDPVLNLVDYLKAPADIADQLAKQARDLAIQLITKLDMIGILAIEMFLTPEGDLLINEIAPRPHNSGHHTIEANYTSQFAQHMRAVLGLPLGATNQHHLGAMVNLIGEPAYEGIARYQGIEEILKMDGIYVHLYGKKYTKPGRKMGHVTLIHTDSQTLMDNIRLVKEKLKVISD